MKLLCCVSLLFVVGLAGCGDDDAGCVEGMSITCACTDGSSGAQVCQADGRYAACVCGGRPSGTDAETPFDAGPGFDGGSGSGVSCESRGANFNGQSCGERFVACTNTFTYAVQCDGTNCRCIENDIEQGSFPESNYCGDISDAFRTNLATTNCGWDWTTR
ncbi:MAG: hypothetical protein AB8H86_22245 [Polyangiales bacterium]